MAATEDFLSDRRRFFREGLGKLVSPLADYMERRVFPDGGRVYLRPPGALPEADFLDTCHRCGACVDACPAHAIITLRSEDRQLASTPVIHAASSACVVCDDLACMSACPSGALIPVPREAIRMGAAIWDAEKCVRTDGEDCTICVDDCPIGPTAIRVSDERGIEVLQPGCTGCGVCEMRCPTRPKSIRVLPKERIEL